MDEKIFACKECTQAALRGMSEPLKQIATSDGPIFLFQCDKCGCLWEENLREAHPILRDYAQKRFKFR